jgi:hypothetical protein
VATYLVVRKFCSIAVPQELSSTFYHECSLTLTLQRREAGRLCNVAAVRFPIR